MTLCIYLLGQPRIKIDERPVATDTRKAVALLAYLAVTSEYQSRDTLATLLWPEMDDEHGRAALRRTLSALRSAIGDQALHVSRDGLRIDPDNCWCDVVEFERNVAAVNHHVHSGSPCPHCLEKMESAIGLYRDHFLSGFSLRDSAEFDGWQLAEAEYLRRSFSAALGWLVQAYSQVGAFEKAIDLGRRWLAVDPLREDAHQWLMQLYAWSGVRDAALRQYREAVRILGEELGVGPLTETTALYEAIQEGRLAPPAELILTDESKDVNTVDEPRRPLEHAPLIGRESAWSALQDAYRDVTTSGRLAAITGEAGIGKTYFVETFLHHIRGQGASAVTATCYEGETNLAYAPISAGLRALWSLSTTAERLPAIQAHWLGEVIRLVPDLEVGTSAPPTSAESGTSARFFAGISEVFCHLLSSNLPGVFFLDDAHWADEASLDLLAYLVRRMGDLPILLIISWATGSGNDSGVVHRLRRLIAEAQRAGTGRLIGLTRWRPSDILSLVTADHDLQPRSAEITDRLYRETEGLPYFVIEYLTALGDSPDRWTMPQSVRDLLVGRLAEVDQTGRQLLQTAAVIGRSFDYTILWEASGRSEEEVIGGLERLLASNLIREVAEGRETGGTEGEGPADDLRYDFAHQQLRLLVYEETTLARRRLLHRRVAAALQAHARGPQGEAMAALIADHFHLGGQDSLAADFYRRAGQYARSLYANREALGHFRTALAMGHPNTTELHEAMGDMHTLLGEYQAALQAFESAAAQAQAVEEGRLEHKLGQVYERRGDWELAESHYCAALNRYQQAEQTIDLAPLNVDRSRVAYRSGHPEMARTLANEALVLAEVTGDLTAEAQAHNTLGILARQEGETANAREHLERSLALAETAGMTPVRVAALNNLARLHESDGQSEAALALLEQAIALCTFEGDRHREAALYNHRADILHRAGQEEAAMTSLKQAVAIYAEIGIESGDWQPEIWKLTEW